MILCIHNKNIEKLLILVSFQTETGFFLFFFSYLVSLVVKDTKPFIGNCITIEVNVSEKNEFLRYLFSISIQC